jgi:ferric-dicitrate binding protein FerR (iron transport regulator)
MGMHAHESNELEQRLREAFEPNSGAIERVIAAAMRPRRRPPAGLIAVAALALLSAGLVWVYFAHETMPVHAESIRLEYVGTVALFEFPDGSSWIVSPDAASQGPDTNFNLIIYEGDKP